MPASPGFPRRTQGQYSPSRTRSAKLRWENAQGRTLQVLKDHEGRSVRLTDERLAHLLEHPEMQGLEAEIARTLLEPDLVVQSRADPEVRLAYQFLPETKVGPKFLAVVVKASAEDAFVVTAYLTDKPKAGRTLWTRKR